ncbi:MAG: potassium channel family protein [Burkholderiaceae bacterium]
MPQPLHDSDDASLHQAIARERDTLLERLDRWLQTPMLVLAFVWLALFVIESIRGLTPLLQQLGYLIWGAFAVEFLIGWIVAPRKLDYLKHNWLKAVSLLAPALRLVRVASLLRVLRLSRLAGATRGLRLLRLFSSVNRGMAALGASMGRRGVAYVLALTLIVTLTGAAGMMTFEPDALGKYGTALWWTAMLMTTMGSEYWPKTPEGRLLCFFLALYSFTVFGYVTAALATFFVGRDAEDPDGGVAGAASVDALRTEIAALREEIRMLARDRAR